MGVTPVNNPKHAFDVRGENAFNFLSQKCLLLFNGSAASPFQHFHMVARPLQRLPF